MAIYFTSDLHFCHNREFIYKARGFDSVEDMNAAIVKNWNSVVTNEDDIYVLGDLMLKDNETGLKLIKSLKGRIHVVLGNHDTDTREKLYHACPNIVEVENAIRLNKNGYHLFMTHYPCFTANLEAESLKKCTINFFGHTHQQGNFYNDIPFMYHVGVDSHNCTPVSFEQAIEDMKAKVNECVEML